MTRKTAAADGAEAFAPTPADPPSSIEQAPATTHFGYQQVPVAEKTRRVGEVFSSVAARYDLMNDLMSLGAHRLWKRHFIGVANPRPGQRVLDLAGGTGDIAALIAPRVGPSGQAVLSDINYAMLRRGRDRLIDEALVSHTAVAQVDAQAIAFADQSFDLVTIAFGLRNVTDPLRALKEIHRVLKFGGRVLILEFSQVTVEPLRQLYDTYSFSVLPRLGEWVAKDRDSYQYLAESIRKHPDQETLAQLMREAGLERVDYHNLLAGVVAIHSGRRL